jgi:hypothetical protein
VALISNFAAHLHQDAESTSSAAAQARAAAPAHTTAGKEEEGERAEQFESAFVLLQHLTSFLSPDAPSLSDVRPSLLLLPQTLKGKK